MRNLPLRRIHQEAKRVMCIREEAELLKDGSSVRVMNVNYAGCHQDGITHYVQWHIEDPAAEKGWLYIERKKVSNLPVVTIPFPTYEAALSYLFSVLGWDRPFEIEQISKPQLATVSDWSQYSDAGMFS